MSARPLHRSYLYAPGDRPDVMAKALASAADAVVLDLEDAVAPASRPAARGHVGDTVAGRVGHGGPEVHVRVNRGAGGYDTSDLEAVTRSGLDAVRLPKAEEPDEVAHVDALLTELEAARGLASGSVALYPTVESARGLVRVAALVAASPRVVRVAFGASDYLADVHADDLAADHARHELVVASRAAGVGPPIDSVHTDLADVDGLAAAAAHARRLGMHGKTVVHPRQLEPVHAAFTPTPEELDHARRLLEAWDAASARDQHAIEVDGQFLDPAVVARLRGLLRLDPGDQG